MARRARSDSLAGARRAMAGASAPPLEPPPHVLLRDKDRPYWLTIIEARARERWDPLDLTLAANLARLLSDLEDYQRELDALGPDRFVENDKSGSIKPHPLFALIDAGSRRAVAMSRALHVHAEAKQGKAKLQGKAVEKQREARQTLDGADGLIKRPAGGVH